MHWLLLIIAAIFEIGWPLGFKLSSTQPERFWTWITFAIVSMALSGVFLYFAQRTIPVSTAYIIWTGLGAVGTLLIGIKTRDKFKCSNCEYRYLCPPVSELEFCQLRTACNKNI